MPDGRGTIVHKSGTRLGILALTTLTLGLLTATAGATSAEKLVAIRVSNMQAIQAATINAADEDPAQDATRLTKVSFVMKGGKVVKPLTP